MCALGSNPVYCMACNLEVPTERYQPDGQLCYDLSHWVGLYNAMERLWLDSADYERWAAEQFCDIHSRVNRLGLALPGRLNLLRRTYFWVWQDQPTDDFEAIKACPLCGGLLQESPLGTYKQVVCEKCLIVAAAD
jgi:predicted  nucleic acid-binding Zn ribbon protein